MKFQLTFALIMTVLAAPCHSNEVKLLTEDEFKSCIDIVDEYYETIDSVDLAKKSLSEERPKYNRALFQINDLKREHDTLIAKNLELKEVIRQRTEGGYDSPYFIERYNKNIAKIVKIETIRPPMIVQLNVQSDNIKDLEFRIRRDELLEAILKSKVERQCENTTAQISLINQLCSLNPGVYCRSFPVVAESLR